MPQVGRKEEPAGREEQPLPQHADRPELRASPDAARVQELEREACVAEQVHCRVVHGEDDRHLPRLPIDPRGVAQAADQLGGLLGRRVVRDVLHEALPAKAGEEAGGSWREPVFGAVAGRWRSGAHAAARGGGRRAGAGRSGARSHEQACALRSAAAAAPRARRTARWTRRALSECADSSGRSELRRRAARRTPSGRGARAAARGGLRRSACPPRAPAQRGRMPCGRGQVSGRGAAQAASAQWPSAE